MTDNIDEINLPLLRKAIEAIEAHPEAFNYNIWWSAYDAYDADILSEELERPIHCGTVGCLAGWIVELGTGGAHQNIIYSNSLKAQELLGIDGDTADDLFSPDEHVNRDPANRLRRHVEEILDMEPGTL